MKTKDYGMCVLFMVLVMVSIYTLGTWVDAKFANVEGSISKGFCHCEKNKKSS